MKTTLDTNIFLYASISESCAGKVNETYNKNNFNIILRIVNEESRPKLVELSMIFSVLQDEITKTRNPIKLIESDYYEYFKSKYPQIHKAIKNYIVRNNINSKKKSKELTRVVDLIINDLKFLIQLVSNGRLFFPTTEEDFEKLKKSKSFKDCMEKLKEIIKANDNDRMNISLCNEYIINLKNDKMGFCTIDKDDFIKHNNKEKIEKIVKNLIIETLPELDVENIKIKK
jgi:hypothetical protein